LATIIQEEENRYKRKGYGLISASVLALTFFYAAPYVGQEVWPTLLRWFPTPVSLYICVGLGVQVLVLAITNLTLWLVYHLEWPFFERYKITREPWPWNADPQKWYAHVGKTL